MVSTINCIDKERMKNIPRNPCLECKKRWKGCPRKHELIDSNIILNRFLNNKDIDNWSKLLELNGKKYTGYITTIQIGHTIRAFSEKFNEINISNSRDKGAEIRQLMYKYGECTSELLKFHIVDFDKSFEPILKNLNEKETRMESHDKMNIAIAIANKLYIQVIDNDLEEDFLTVKEISEQFGFNIKKNEKYD